MALKKTQPNIQKSITDSLQASPLPQNLGKMNAGGLDDTTSFGKHCNDTTKGCQITDQPFSSCACSCNRCQTAMN